MTPQSAPPAVLAQGFGLSLTARRIGAALGGAILTIAPQAVHAQGTTNASSRVIVSIAHDLESRALALPAAATGVVEIRGRVKSRALRDLDFRRDPRCYTVVRSTHSKKWLMIGFSSWATGRYAKCRPFDANVIAAKRDGEYQWVVTDNLRNSCKTFELDLFRAGAPGKVVQDLRAAKGCRATPS